MPFAGLGTSTSWALLFDPRRWAGHNDGVPDASTPARSIDTACPLSAEWHLDHHSACTKTMPQGIRTTGATHPAGPSMPTRAMTINAGRFRTPFGFIWTKLSLVRRLGLVLIVIGRLRDQAVVSVVHSHVFCVLDFSDSARLEPDT
jgi:hypothetical protein